MQLENLSQCIDVGIGRRIGCALCSEYVAVLLQQQTVTAPYLAEKFEISGGNIKNIAINSAFMAAKDSQKIKMEYILKAAVYELKKQGKTIIEDDLGEYAYMIKL